MRFTSLVRATAFLAVATPAVAQQLPASLSDQDFWAMVSGFSEPGGSFLSDNFTSNEMGYPAILNRLRDAHDTGGVYMGVGPEQNFSYIAGIRPHMAFIVDIRRQSIVQHLMYKAIFELSADRADFLALLFSKPRPAGLDTSLTINKLWDAYWPVETDTSRYRANFTKILHQLTQTHHFALDAADSTSLEYVYRAFYNLGPKINYSGNASSVNGGYMISSFSAVGPPISVIAHDSIVMRLHNGIVDTLRMIRDTVRGTINMSFRVPEVKGAGAPIPTTLTPYPGAVTFASLTAATDLAGVARSFLATEDSYRYVKDLESRNMMVPVVGDFGGPKAIRAVGDYVRAHGAKITAFYVSNVESYLFGGNPRAPNAGYVNFYDNVGTLPVDSSSVFIRNGSSTCPIPAFLQAYRAGLVHSYMDAVRCVQ